MNRLRVLFLSLVLVLVLVLVLPAQALDLQGLYEQALTASRQGDFVEALPLWDRFLEQAPDCLLYTSPSPRDLSTSRMPSSA